MHLLLKNILINTNQNITSLLSYFNNIIEDILKMNNKQLNEGIWSLIKKYDCKIINRSNVAFQKQYSINKILINLMKLNFFV